MACDKTLTIAGKTCRLYRTTDSGLCSYKVVVTAMAEADTVIDKAKTRTKYAKHSQRYSIPEGRIQFYLYFHE